MDNLDNEMGIVIQKETLIINFGAHIDWVGMSRDEALKFAEVVKQHAEAMNVGVTD